MDADFYRGFGKSGQIRRFRNRKPFELHMQNRTSLFFRQPFEQDTDIAPRTCLLVVVIFGKYGFVVVERFVQRLSPCVFPEEVHQFVAGYRVDPRGKRLVWSKTVTCMMHRQQYFLNEIFDIIPEARNLFSQISPQVWGEFGKK